MYLNRTFVCLFLIHRVCAFVSSALPVNLFSEIFKQIIELGRKRSSTGPVKLCVCVRAHQHVPLKCQSLALFLRDREAHPIRVATAFAAVFIKGLQLEKINFAQDKTRASAEDFFREAVTEGSSPVRQSDGSSRSCKASTRNSGILRSNH